MPSPSSSLTEGTLEGEILSKSLKTSKTTNVNNSSRESFDLALDIDIEKRLYPEPHEKVDIASTAGPLTLAHDDPDNPRNWSLSKKIVVDLVLCVWVLSLTYASTAYIASLPALEARYNMSQEVTILGVTLFVLGFSAGPLIAGPSSELYGRRAVYVITGFFFSVFAWAAAFAPNAAGLLIFRFLTGFFGSSSINNVPASVGDFTIPVTRGPFTVPYALMAFGGPALGPLASSYIETYLGYQWNFKVMAILCTVTSLAVAFVPETHGPTLQKWKNQKTDNPPPSLTVNQVMGVYKTAFSRPIIYLFTEPTVTLVSIYLSVLYGLLYGFFEAFAIVYVDIRGFSGPSYGLTYIALGLGFFIACILLGTAGNSFYLRAAAVATSKGLKTQPEARLGLAYIGAIISPCSLFLFAWTAPFVQVHWIVPCIAEGFFGLSMLLIFTAFIPYLIDVYLTTAASALAAGMASRALVGSLFMYATLSVQGATSLLAGLACCLAPIPFVFRVYGPRMRERSKYAIVQ